MTNFRSHNSKIQIDLAGVSPIYSGEAERDVMGAMLADPEQTMDMVLENLVAEDFFNPSYQILFKALSEMRDGSIPIDPMTVLQYLEDRKLSDSVGGASVITDLASGILSVLSAPTRIKTVKDKSTLRKLQQGCARIVYNAQENQHDVAYVTDHAEQTIFSITENRCSEDLIRPKQSATDALRQIVDQKDKGVGLRGIPTGMLKLDSYMFGLEPGMHVVAARPNQGKTYMGLTWMNYQTCNKIPVGFISLEMSPKELDTRMLSIKSKVPLSKIQEAIRLTNKEDDKLALAYDDLLNSPYVYAFAPNGTLAQVRSLARKMKKRDGIKVLFVDYLQIVDAPGDNSVERAKNASKGIKALSGELEIPIVALAQLKREDDPRKSERWPIPDDLAETDQIFRDADTLLFIHRKRTEDGIPDFFGKLIPGKGRNKLLYPIDIVCNPDTGEFLEDSSKNPAK